MSNPLKTKEKKQIRRQKRKLREQEQAREKRVALAARAKSKKSQTSFASRTRGALGRFWTKAARSLPKGLVYFVGSLALVMTSLVGRVGDGHSEPVPAPEMKPDSTISAQQQHTPPSVEARQPDTTSGTISAVSGVSVTAGERVAPEKPLKLRPKMTKRDYRAIKKATVKTPEQSKAPDVSAKTVASVAAATMFSGKTDPRLVAVDPLLHDTYTMPTDGTAHASFGSEKEQTHALDSATVPRVEWVMSVEFGQDTHTKKTDSDEKSDTKQGIVKVFKIDRVTGKVTQFGAASSISTPPYNKNGKRYDTNRSYVFAGTGVAPGEEGFSVQGALGSLNGPGSRIMADFIKWYDTKVENMDYHRVDEDSSSPRILARVDAKYVKTLVKTKLNKVGSHLAIQAGPTAVVGTDRDSIGLQGTISLSSSDKFDPSVPSLKKGEWGVYATGTGDAVVYDVETDKVGTAFLNAGIQIGAKKRVSEKVELSVRFEQPLTSPVDSVKGTPAGRIWGGLHFHF